MCKQIRRGLVALAFDERQIALIAQDSERRVYMDDISTDSDQLPLECVGIA